MDLSPTGARLSIEGEITKSFALLLSLSSAGRKARIKWRRGNLVGIQFLYITSRFAAKRTCGGPPG